MIRRPSRRDIIKTAAGLTAAGSLGPCYVARARAEAPIKPEP
jgi:hypothetical protein